MRIKDLTNNTDAQQSEDVTPTVQRLLESDNQPENWTEWKDFDSFMTYCEKVMNG